MALVTLEAVFDGVTNVPRLPGQSDVEWFENSIGRYSAWHSDASDEFIGTAKLTGESWKVGYMKMASENGTFIVKDLDDGADRRIDFLELGYNSEVDLMSTQVRYVFGWDGDKHVVNLGDTAWTNSISLYAKQNVVDTGSTWVSLIETGGNDRIVIGGEGAGAVRTNSNGGIGNDKVTAKGWVELIRTGDGKDRVVVKDGAELVKTADGNDKVITGDGWVQTISTGDGNDVVKLGNGGAGGVYLFGGNDRVFVKEVNPDYGVDIRGQGGVDTILFKGFSVGVTFGLYTTAYQNLSGKGYFRQSSMENITGSKKGDTLTGSSDSNVLKGLRGDDTLAGLEGDDKLIGNAGKDVFVFGADAGTDKVKGFQDGSDLLRIEDHSGGFAGLDISKAGKDLEIDHDGGTIILLGRADLKLSADDFDFV